jgi:hypothetical protein
VIDFIEIDPDADSRPTILPIFNLYMHRILRCSL